MSQYYLLVSSVVVILNLVNSVLKTMSTILGLFETFLIPSLICLGDLFYARTSVFLKRGLFLLLKLNKLFSDLS